MWSRACQKARKQLLPPKVHTDGQIVESSDLSAWRSDILKVEFEQQDNWSEVVLCLGLKMLVI